jgi:hypothetical protein
MNKKKSPVNQDLRNEVLAIIDKLYSEFGLIDRDSNYIALQIIESIILDYCTQNCELGFIFDEKVLPHLKKLSENQRLQAVKDLLTDGYIDIKKERIHMMFMPYLNYDKKKEGRKKYFISEVTSV